MALCTFCGEKMIVPRLHHCPYGYFELPKKRMGSTRFLIYAIVVISILTVFVIKVVI